MKKFSPKQVLFLAATTFFTLSFQAQAHSNSGFENCQGASQNSEYGLNSSLFTLQEGKSLAEVFQEELLQPAGFRVGKTALTAPYVLWGDGSIDEAELEDYIDKHNGNVPHSAALAEKISVVSACFGIDSHVFTNLVKKESTFDGTKKGDNGYGLTQMTTDGVNEVNHQLGLYGTDQANAEAIQYFNGVIKNCIEPKLLNGKKWTPLWNRPSIQALIEARRSKAEISLAMRKEMLDPDTALISGAILLKTYLAVYRRQYPKNNVSDIYWKALWRYNGNVQNQRDYANKVMAWADQLHTVTSRLN